MEDRTELHGSNGFTAQWEYERAFFAKIGFDEREPVIFGLLRPLSIKTVQIPTDSLFCGIPSLIFP